MPATSSGRLRGSELRWRRWQFGKSGNIVLSGPAAASRSLTLLRSFKHPDEAKLLRQVYGEAFSLVGVASSAEERRKTLSDSYSPLDDVLALEAEGLVARDESDSGNRQFGQNVRDTYFMADVFVPGTGMDIGRDVNRYVDSVFGHPFLTPRPAEEGMRFAQVAALRSAAPARQVGAALIPEVGTPVVAGTNEVPRPGGGQYWEGDRPDRRDFQEGQDPNPNYIRGVLQELFERLKKHNWLVDDLKNLSGPALVDRARTVRRCRKLGSRWGARVCADRVHALPARGTGCNNQCRAFGGQHAGCDPLHHDFSLS